MCISSRISKCILHLTNKERTRRKRKRGTRDKEREREKKEKRERSRGDSREGKREKKKTRVSSQRSRAKAIGMNPVSSSVLLRSLVMFGTKRGRCWGRGRVAYQRAPAVSRTMDHPAFPILLIRRRLLQEGYDEGFARESARAHCWSALSRALALNIKTLYMSANVPCSTDDIDLHNKRTLRRKREKRRESERRPQKDPANPT